jgi:hypothetical protein
MIERVKNVKEHKQWMIHTLIYQGKAQLNACTQRKRAESRLHESVPSNTATSITPPGLAENQWAQRWLAQIGIPEGHDLMTFSVPRLPHYDKGRESYKLNKTINDHFNINKREYGHLKTRKSRCP